MTTVTFDVSYGTRPVPFRLPYLSVRRHRAATATAAPARARRAPLPASATARTVDRALATREADVDRGLALRAGAGL
jgi:hypothetical protein